jgi:hypothetical protein
VAARLSEDPSRLTPCGSVPYASCMREKKTSRLEASWRKTSWRRWVLVSAGSLSWPVTAAAQGEQPTSAGLGRDPGPFGRGRARVSVTAGTGSSVGDEYLLLGAGVGYYIVDGLELGLDYEAWLFGDPIVNRVSPGARYVFHFVPTVKPYVGTFYRHAFVSDDDDLDYAGARAGIYIVPPASRVSFGAGAAYERVLDCSEDLFVDCDSIYPELSFSFSL